MNQSQIDFCDKHGSYDSGQRWLDMKIAVIGLGFVGLTLGSVLASKGPAIKCGLPSTTFLGAVDIGKAYFARNFKINEIKDIISNINKTL